MSDGVYSSVKEPKPLLYDTPKEQPLIDFSTEANVYDNKGKVTWKLLIMKWSSKPYIWPVSQYT